MYKQKGMVGVFFAFWALIVFVMAVGWVFNIIQLTKMSFTPVTTELILRCIGVFLAPLGTIMGYFA